jgi:hypothetical protein
MHIYWVVRNFPSVKVIYFAINCHEYTDRKYKYSSILSLTSVLDDGGWSTPRPGRFTPGQEPTAVLDGRGKSRPVQDPIPGLLGLCQVAIPTELSRPTAASILTQI